MNVQYETGKGFKFTEEDNYREGCLPGTSQMWDIDVEFQGETKEEVTAKIKDFFGVNDNYLDINACDEKGRIDIAILENAEGHEASQREIELWKKERIKLWYAVYTFNISKVTREEITL